MDHLRFVRQRVKPHHLLLVFMAMVPFTVLVQYAQENARNVPRYDEWRSLFLVFAIAKEDFHWELLFAPHQGQITVFTNITTALMTYYTQWNLKAFVWINLILGMVNFALLGVLLARDRSKFILSTAVAFSALMFSIQQDFNWIIGYMTPWHFTLLFFLLALLSLYRLTPLRFLWAVIGATCATFSTGGGIVSWVALLIYIVLSHGWRWRYIGLWILFTGLAAWSYFSLIAPNSSPQIDFSLAYFWQVIQFTLIAIGAIFQGTGDSNFSLFVAVVGLITFGVNLWFTYQQQKRLPTYWIAIALFALGVATLAGLNRVAEFGSAHGLNTWYRTIHTPFWVAWVAVAAIAYDLNQRSWLQWVNVICVGMLCLLYVPTNQMAVHTNLSNQIRGVEDRCVQRWIFVQNDIPNCPIVDPTVYQLNQLAYYRLALFADGQRESILNDNFADDAPVLVETHNAWLNTHLRDYFLVGVAPERIYHVFPSDDSLLAEIPEPPQQVIFPDDPEALTQLQQTLTQVPAFWYIRRVDYETTMPAFWESLQAQGYIAIDTHTRNEGILISRMQYVPAMTEDQPVFGDHITWVASNLYPETLAPCESVTLNSFWQTDARLEVDYSASLRLFNAAGEQVLQNDLQLSTVGTKGWEVGQIYSDQRLLTLPCDLPVGEYELRLAIYFYQAPNDLLTVAGDPLPVIGSLTVVPLATDPTGG